MNKIYFSTILSLITAIATSQNWIPLVQGDKYNYQPDNSSIITATIWIDSAKVIQGDSVFFLNRIAAHCDTCTAALGGTPEPCDSCYMLINQPQFLQRKMIKKGDGIYVFRDTSKLMLRTKAQLNETWVFDSLNNTTAQVTDISVQQLFGVQDSVKTISLSTGNSILLSKSYGIISFPDLKGSEFTYELKGIEGSNMGEKVPDFWDIYNFDVGDVFEYYAEGGDAYLSGWYIKKYEINSKYISGDSIVYEISGLQMTVTFLAGVTYDVINTTLIYIDSANHAANKYNNELICIGTDYAPWSLFSKINLGIDSNNVPVKYYGNNYGDNNYLYHILEGVPDVMVAYIDEVYGGYRQYDKLAANLGTVHFVEGAFEYWFDESLEGYIKDGDTVGTITPDSLLTAISEQSAYNDDIKIYPNPAIDHFTLALPSGYQIKNCEVTLSNIQGRLIFRQPVTEFTTKFDISRLPGGVYFLKVNDGIKSTIHKILKEP